MLRLAGSSSLLFACAGGPSTMHPALSHPVNDLAHLPLVLLIADMARVYRRSIGTIRRDCQRNVFRPPPRWRRPYRWLRADVERDLTQRTEELTTTTRPVAVQPTRRRRGR